MPFTPEPARCRNCKKKFTRNKPTQVFCKAKCRNDYHNYGNTPQAQMEGRLKSYMRSKEFRAMMKVAVKESVRAVLDEFLQPVQDRSESGSVLNDPRYFPKR